MAVVDDPVHPHIHIGPGGGLLGVGVRADVEAYHDGTGGGGQGDVGLVDRAYAAVDTFDNDFLVGKLRQALLDCFHAALYIRFDNQVQFL